MSPCPFIFEHNFFSDSEPTRPMEDKGCFVETGVGPLSSSKGVFQLVKWIVPVTEVGFFEAVLVV